MFNKIGASFASLTGNKCIVHEFSEKSPKGQSRADWKISLQKSSGKKSFELQKRSKNPRAEKKLAPNIGSSKSNLITVIKYTNLS